MSGRFGEESTGSVSTYFSSPVKMGASRFGQPVLECTSAPAGKSLRCTEISLIEAPPRRSKGSSITSSSKRKKSCGPSTSSGAVPSTSQSHNKCPPRLYAKGHPAAAAAEDSFVAAADIYAYPSGYEQATIVQNSESECAWPNWPHWGTENRNELDGVDGQIARPICSDTSSSYWGNGTHNELDCVAGRIRRPSHSDTSSCSSLSDSESDLARLTSSSSGSRAHEMRKTYSFWEDFVWGERRPWKKLRHKSSFLANLWDFKPETKVEESCDPILVSVNVLGSPGPLRLLVDKNDSVHHTIDFALRRYTAQKRQPALVDPAPFFGLYCRNPDFEALDDEELIGYRDSRQFHLYHKQRTDLDVENMGVNDASSCKNDETTTLTPTRNWFWSNINGMRSWAGNMIASISSTLTFWVAYLNPRRFYRFIYMVSLKAMNLGIT